MHVSPDDQPDLDAVLADAIRRAYVRPVDEVAARRHVSAIVAAATADAEPDPRRSPRRRRVWRPLVAATAAACVLPAGLAVAGVPLPDVVQEPYRAIGITLPHQPRDASPAPPPSTTENPSTTQTPSTTTTTPQPPRAADQRGRDARRGHERSKPRKARPAEAAHAGLPCPAAPARSRGPGSAGEVPPSTSRRPRRRAPAPGERRRTSGPRRLPRDARTTASEQKKHTRPQRPSRHRPMVRALRAIVIPTPPDRRVPWA